VAAGSGSDSEESRLVFQRRWQRGASVRSLAVEASRAAVSITGGRRAAGAPPPEAEVEDRGEQGSNGEEVLLNSDNGDGRRGGHCKQSRDRWSFAIPVSSTVAGYNPEIPKPRGQI
jgi:hypothetical protein